MSKPPSQPWWHPYVYGRIGLMISFALGMLIVRIIRAIAG